MPEPGTHSLGCWCSPGQRHVRQSESDWGYLVVSYVMLKILMKGESDTV